MTAIIIWILAAVAVALAGLSARAFFLEKREGLPRSTQRLGASAAVAIVLVALGVFATLQARPRDVAPAPTSATEAPAKHDAATDAKIKDLHAKIDDLTKQLDTATAELDKLDPHAHASALKPAEPDAPSSWPLLAAVALVLAAFAALTLGDLETLIPRRKQKSDAAAAEAAAAAKDAAKDGDADAPLEPATLPNLVAHATAGRWAAGAALGARIQPSTLGKLEVLDLLYLRAYCTACSVIAPEDGKPVGAKPKADRLAAASAELADLLELAPHMAEARWLAGYIAAHAGDPQKALDDMRAARPDLAGDSSIGRAFDRDESVCLLVLAEGRLAAADNDGATKLFDEVTKIGALAAQIPVALVTHRFLAARADIKAGKLAEAAAAIAHIRQVTGLEGNAQRGTELACDVYAVAIDLRSGEHAKVLAGATQLFEKWLPKQLPDVDDQAADEYLLPAIDAAQLALPAEIYRCLFYVKAVARVELGARSGLDPSDVDAIATALLRALQFQPRHRESLAALAALYLAYRPERSEKALGWLDAAITMGVRSPRAAQLLGDARRAERERKELLALFRSASARFLADPAVEAAVREALIEELGRFDEFRPVVLDLRATGALDAPPASAITIAALRERAAFVGGVAAEVVRRADPAAVAPLADIHRELTALANNVDSSATRIAALERAVMEQLGRIVLR